MIGTAIAIVTFELLCILAYSVNVYAELVMPISSAFPHSIISIFFSNDYVYTPPLTQTQYLNVSGRVVTMLSHSQQIIGTIFSIAIFFLVRRERISSRHMVKVSILDNYAFGTLFISQLLFLIDNLDGTFLLPQIYIYNKNADIQTIALFFIFVGLVLFIANYLLFAPPGVLQPEMQYGYDDYEQLKTYFIVETEGLEGFNRNSIRILIIKNKKIK